MRIRKVTQSVIPPEEASIVDGYSTSQTDGYSCNYINNNFVGNVDIEYDTPIKTGRRFKVNGVWKNEYIYYKNVGTLPNNNVVSYTTNIDKSAVTMVTDTGGVAYRSSDGAMVIMNGARPTANNMAIGCQLTWSNDNKFQFYIETGSDRSNCVGHCWVTYY